MTVGQGSGFRHIVNFDYCALLTYLLPNMSSCVSLVAFTITVDCQAKLVSEMRLLPYVLSGMSTATYLLTVTDICRFRFRLPFVYCVFS